jgi:hypothetical protein
VFWVSGGSEKTTSDTSGVTMAVVMSISFRF